MIKLKQFIDEFDTCFQFYAIVGKDVSITDRANLYYEGGMEENIYDFYADVAEDQSVLYDLQEYYVITLDRTPGEIVVILGTEEDYRYWQFVRKHCMDDL